MKKRFIVCYLIILFSLPLSLTGPKGKCCNKTDSLHSEVKKVETVEEPAKCHKEEEKKDKKFSMTSLTLMNYLINKFISPSYQE